MAKAIAGGRAARERFAKRLRRGSHGTRARPSILTGALAVIAFIILSSLISGSYLPRASAQASSNSQKTFNGTFQYKSIQPICALGTCGVFDFSGTFMVTINLTSGLGPLPPQQTGVGSGTIIDSGMCVGQGTVSYTFGVTGDYFPNQGLSVEFGPLATPSDISWTDTCTDSTGRVYQQPQDTVIIAVVPLGAMFANSTKVEGDCTQCFGVPPVHYVITANSQTSDSPLEAVNLNVDSPTEGITHSGLIVGAFRDTDASDTGSGFSATIDWGDHSTTSGGSIVPTSNQGGYNVTGTHLYKEAGKFSISVTVNDPTEVEQP